MKTFDWRACFNEHPVFWDLAEDELARLLDDNLSREIICQPQQVIVREGDEGDSVFLIGEGEVDVLLEGDREPGTQIATLGPGEFFGEMAVLERRPRMATVVAGEQSTLLEINGAQFRRFLVEHPEIEFKMAAKLSQRLRDLTEHVLSARFKDVDQKLALFNNKLDSELKVIDASMKATQAVFDQTNKRANEVIESAERSRGRLAATVSIVAGVIGILVSALGYLGVKTLDKMEAELQTYQEFKANVSQVMQKGTLENLNNINEQYDDLTNNFDEAVLKLDQAVKKIHLTVLIPELSPKVIEEDPSRYQLYREIMEQPDWEITTSLLKVMLGELSKKDNRTLFIDLLRDSIRRGYLTPKQEISSYYLMLSTMVIAGMETEYKFFMPVYLQIAGEYRDTEESLRDQLISEIDPETFRIVLEREATDEWLPSELQSRQIKLKEIWDAVPRKSEPSA
jgi:CRP/FNR family cyclic AMP-dependent transcriptional regulator